MIKIAGLMRSELDSGFTILEISKRLGIGYRPAYNHIIAMNNEGIIKVEKIGNAKQCRLNLNSQKCRHLLEELDAAKKEEIYRKYPKIKAIIEDMITKLTNDFVSDIHSIVLFGSYAKGLASKTSDIDLLFIVTDLKNRQLREGIERESAGYMYSYSIKVSPMISDIGELKRMIKAPEMNVGKESREHGISLYGSEMFWRIAV